METNSLIEVFRENFEYKEGVLYWKEGTERARKPVGSLTSGGYLQVSLKLAKGINKTFANHRIIFAMHHGYFPALVDHKDRNKLNNLIDNLREGDKSVNAINTGLFSNSTSGIKGVCYDKKAKKWMAHIKKNYKFIFLGYFNTKEEAAEARKRGEEVYHDI